MDILDIIILIVSVIVGGFLYIKMKENNSDMYNGRNKSWRDKKK